MTLTALAAVFAVGLLLIPKSSEVVSAQESKRGDDVERATAAMIAYALTHKADDKAATFNIMNQLPCTEINGASGTLEPGVYCLSSTEMAGQLVLDGKNDRSSTFIFRVAGALNTKRGASIDLVNGAEASNVHFVADSASIAGDVYFKGNILTKDDLSIQDGSKVRGNAFSVNSMVKAAEYSIEGGGTGTLQICKAITAAPPATTDTRLSDRIFRFTISGVAGVIEVPAGQCSGQIDVPTGTRTITELRDGRFINRPGTWFGNFELVDVNILSPNSNSTLGVVNLPQGTAAVTINEGGVGQQLTLEFVNRFAIEGYVEICKRAASGDPDITAFGAAGGFFTYTIAGVYDPTDPTGTRLQTFVAPVGFCTPPIAVTIGEPSPTGEPRRSTVDVTELGRAGFYLESVDTDPDTPFNRLNGIIWNRARTAAGGLALNVGGAVANVTVFEGGAASETIVNFTNRSQPGYVKVCKAAGFGVPEGTVFRFEVAGDLGSTTRPDPNDTTRPLYGPYAPTGAIQFDVIAGPAATGGNCVFVPGIGGTANQVGNSFTITNPNAQTFRVGSEVLVYELGAIDWVTGQLVTSLRPGNPFNPNADQRLFPGGEIRVNRIRSSSGFVPVPTNVTGSDGTPNITLTAATGNPDYTPRGVVGSLVDPARRATTIVPSRRDIVEVEFTNQVFNPTDLKICKIGANGLTGTFTFDITFNPEQGLGGPLQPGPFTTSVSMAAGPAAQGGTCVLIPTSQFAGLVGGALNQGSSITITERAVAGTVVTAITSRTSALSNLNLAGRTVTVAGPNGLVAGVNEVTFTNAAAGGGGTPVADRAAFDFDGDGKSDISIYRNGDWWYASSANGGQHRAIPNFGLATDRIVPADYDGDGTTDAAVYRDGIWHILGSKDGYKGYQFGMAEDIPQPGDFDNDGKADLGVFRPSNGTWYMLKSSEGFGAIQFGMQGDRPVAADYDGDGRTDVGVYRAGTWHLYKSTEGYAGFVFGLASDKVVPADYDGDGKVDPAVYRDGTWYMLKTKEGFGYAVLGNMSDTPVPADFNGDGKADPAVFRGGTWMLTKQGEAGSVAFGLASDMPVPSYFVK